VTRKKIVFVIVEGPSDEEALGVILNRVYDRNAVYIHIVHGDLTTRSNKNPVKNVFASIIGVIKEYADSNHFKKSDFSEIIHLIDTDGAYIPDDNVIEDPKASDPKYSPECIRTCNKPSVEIRNKHKRDNIDRLCVSKSIWGIPYRIFYMSCNLDHALYGKLNSSDAEKEADAYRFIRYYQDKIPEFMRYITESDFSVTGGYEESWNYIKEGLHSLERHTNLGICFAKDARTADEKQQA